MDSVELARQIAAQLHRQAVSSGADPAKPYDFAIAEASRRDLDVEMAAPGAAILNGGRAIFSSLDRLIIHESVGTEFDKAFLVAHEIGHAELGDDPQGEPVREIDPARSAEPSPVGMDRVVDYGRRQRREIQMDIFAREFLLPREVLRFLHLEGRYTASQIAERFKAPFEIVAQQLFDALLLPSIAPDSNENSEAHEPNSLQADAANHRGPAYLLEAGPGTGKTQTLVARVEALLNDGIDPRRILLLTFSNKAAGEMSDRISLKHASAAAAMWIGTFHAFGLDFIRRFHAELGLCKDPRMLDRTEAVELLEQEFPKLGLNHYRDLYDPTQNISDILGAISRAKDEVVDECQYAELANEMLRQAGTEGEKEDAERALEVAKVFEVYESLKRGAGCVDFGDLVSMPVRLLENNETIRAHFQEQYQHILVDEYQDVNRSSVRLLKALCPDGENLWAVGDAKQSIYRFRGASSFNISRFGTEDFAGGRRGRLKRNYRSVEEIVNIFSTFSVQMLAGDPESGLENIRGSGGQNPELRKVASAEEQSVAIADAIQEMFNAGYTYRDQAVLCTGNEKLSALGQDLERLGVPVLFLGSLFERPEVKDLFAFLSILTDRRAMGLVRVASWPTFQMSMSDVAAVLAHLREEDFAPAGWLQNLEAISELTEQGRATLRRVATVLSGFDETSPPWEALARILLDRTRGAADIASSEEIPERARGIAIWQFMNFVRVQPAGQGLPIARLLNRVRRLLRLGDDRDLRQLPAAAQAIDAVRLMTIHGAKGLEFPVVHLPGINADTIPRTPASPPCPPPNGMVEGGKGSAGEILRVAHLEEQQCLFYVALSRARDRLFLFAPTKKSNGHNRSLSPFVDVLGSRLHVRDVVPVRSLPLAPELGEIQLSVDGSLLFSGSQITLYEKCPRRFFYTHILEVGGRRTATPFMRMHDAVHAVFQSAIADNVGDESLTLLEEQVDRAFELQGLAGHGYAVEYRQFALSMLRFFVSTREGHTSEDPTVLAISVGSGKIFVKPDDVLLAPDGRRTLRRIRTGHRRSTDSDDLLAAAFLLAAQEAFPGSAVELVHLSDQSTQAVTLSARMLENRRGKMTGFLDDIRLGRFPAAPSARVCPGCPSFFICGPTPPGVLEKKF